MEQNKAERLNENATEKMCSSDGNVVGEMCSPADADTVGLPGLIWYQHRRLMKLENLLHDLFEICDKIK